MARPAPDIDRVLVSGPNSVSVIRADKMWIVTYAGEGCSIRNINKKGHVRYDQRIYTTSGQAQYKANILNKKFDTNWFRVQEIKLV